MFVLLFKLILEIIGFPLVPICEIIYILAKPDCTAFVLKIILCCQSWNSIFFLIFGFQFNFVRSGGVQLALNMLTKNNFLSNADLPTRRYACVARKVCMSVFVWD